MRRQKKVAFIALGDGSTLDPLQAILRPDQTDGCVEDEVNEQSRTQSSR